MRKRTGWIGRAPRILLRSPLLDFAIVAGSLAAILLVTLYPYTFSIQDFDRIYDLPRHFEGLGRAGLFGTLIGPPLAALADWTAFPIRPNIDISPLGFVEFLANVLLFVPLGFGLASWMRKKALGWPAVFISVLGLGFGFSLIIESVQIFAPSRHTTVLDLLTNSTGALLGFLVFRMRKERRVVLAALTSPRTWALGLVAYVVLCLFLIVAAHTPRLWAPVNWNPSFPLLLGNEATGDRPWHGQVSRLFIADRALTENEVTAIFSSEDFPPSPHNEWLASYSLMDRGSYPDQMGALPDLSWTPALPRLLPTESTRLNRNHWLTTATPATYAIEQIRTSGAFTLGVTLTPDNTTQHGPARIVSNSGGPSERNFTLGQHGRDLVFRLRTPFAGTNGNVVEFTVPEVLSAGEQHHVMATYNPGGFRLYVNDADNIYEVELTAETKIAWLFIYLLTGRFTVDLNNIPPGTHELLCYGSIFIPSVCLLIVIITFQHRRSTSSSSQF